MINEGNFLHGEIAPNHLEAAVKRLGQDSTFISPNPNSVRLGTTTLSMYIYEHPQKISS